MAELPKFNDFAGEKDANKIVSSVTYHAFYLVILPGIFNLVCVRFRYDSHTLDKPDFVGSYDVGEYVYFFFREMAVEFMNCGKTVYSRVARVCKRDTGGKNILNQAS